MAGDIPITVIMCVRNEEGYLRTCLKRLVRQGIRLAVIDNDSTDGTAGILEEFSRHMDRREFLPWDGTLDLVAILEAVARVTKTITHGWVIHQAPDEALDSDDPNESLRDAIERIDRTDANVINFDEFVFLPLGDESFAGRDYVAVGRHYYFHEPQPLRLMRAWRAGSDLSQVHGGHRLSGSDLRLHGRNLPLRHYPFLSLEHARAKYTTRNFAERGLAQGWHGNRRGLLPEDMEFPPVERLKAWTPGRPLDASDPWLRHYWWERKLAREGSPAGSGA